MGTIINKKPDNVISGSRCEITAEWNGGRTRLTKATAETPVGLVQPRAEGPAAWVYLTTLGPGLMEGDDHRYAVEVHPRARLFLGPQSNTRILPCENGGLASLKVHGTVYADACCVLAGDPVVLYKGSRFRTEQRWRIHPGARFLCLEAWVAGRLGNGERFGFESFESRLRLEDDAGRPLHRDAFRVSRREGFEAFSGMGCQLNLWAIGPETEDLEAYLSDWLRMPSTPGARPRWNSEGLLVGLGRQPGRGVGLKALGRARSDLDDLIRAVFAWASRPEWLGGNPWSRKF